MAFLDTLKQMFAGANPVAASGGATLPPEMAFLQQSGLLSPIDKKAEMRMAIAKGLQGLGAGLSSSNDDFLPALSSGLSQGAGNFIGALDDSATKEKSREKEMLDRLFGTAKAEDASQSKADNLALRDEIAKTREEQTNKRLDLLEKLGFGRLGQGQDGLDETARHNKAMEAEKAAKADEAGAKLKQQADKAKTDMEKLRVEINNGKLRGDDIRTATLSRIEKMKGAKAKELKLDDPQLREDDPEAHAAAVLEYQSYVKGLEDKIKGTAVPPPQETNDSPMVTTPPPLKDRVIGQIVMTPKGQFRWTQDGWEKIGDGQ